MTEKWYLPKSELSDEEIARRIRKHATDIAKTVVAIEGRNCRQTSDDLSNDNFAKELQKHLEKLKKQQAEEDEKVEKERAENAEEDADEMEEVPGPAPVRVFKAASRFDIHRALKDSGFKWSTLTGFDEAEFWSPQGQASYLRDYLTKELGEDILQIGINSFDVDTAIALWTMYQTTSWSQSQFSGHTNGTGTSSLRRIVDCSFWKTRESRKKSRGEEGGGKKRQATAYVGSHPFGWTGSAK